jgi:predicted protein tyrosine phosphatase
MKKHPIRSEDLYPEGADAHCYQGISARKGTVAAVLANIDILEASDSTEEEKKQALEQIKEYAPVFIAIGMHQKVIWNNPQVQELMDSASRCC